MNYFLCPLARTRVPVDGSLHCSRHPDWRETSNCPSLGVLDAGARSLHLQLRKSWPKYTRSTDDKHRLLICLVMDDGSSLLLFTRYFNACFNQLLMEMRFARRLDT